MVCRDGVKVVAVASRFTATLFFKGLGLGAGMGDRREQPVPVHGFVVMVSQRHPGARRKIRAIAFTTGGTGVAAQGLQPGFGERSAACVLFESTRVVEMLVILPVHQRIAGLFMHQSIGWVGEGVIFHGDRSGTHPLSVRKTEHTGRSGIGPCCAVVGRSLQPWRVAMVIGKHQRRWFLSIQAAVLVAVVPPFLGRQPFDKGQIAFPMLDAVFALLGAALEIKDRIDDPPLLKQGAHNRIRALVLEHPAVVHQLQAPERRPDHQLVAGAPMAGITAGKFADHTGKAPQRCPVSPDHQIHRLLQYIGSANGRIGAGQIKTPLEQLRQPFSQCKADNGKVIRGEFANGGGKLQSACLGHVFGP